MKHTLKRTLALLLALIMAFPAYAFAEEPDDAAEAEELIEVLEIDAEAIDEEPAEEPEEEAPEAAEPDATGTTVTLSFNANGGEGTAPAPITVDKGNPITLPAADDLSREGYSFNCWYDQSTIGNLSWDGNKIGSTNLNNAMRGKMHASGTEVTISIDSTYSALWQCAKFTINYDLNGGQKQSGAAMTKSSVDKNYGETASFGAAGGANYEGAKKGFTYPNGKNYTAHVAWYNAKSDAFYGYATTVSYTMDKNIAELNEDGTYSALVQAVWEYTPVAYHLDDETTEYNFVVRTSSGNNATAWTMTTTPAITREGPAKSGATFEGWATEPDGAVVYESGDDRVRRSLSRLLGAERTLRADLLRRPYLGRRDRHPHPARGLPGGA